MAIKRVLIIDDEDDIREVAQVSPEMSGGWEVMTASSSGEGLDDRRRLDDLGVTALLSKPFDPVALTDQVAAALGWRL